MLLLPNVTHMRALFATWLKVRSVTLEISCGSLMRAIIAWRADCEQRKQETIDAVKATANEQIPYNVQGVSYHPLYALFRVLTMNTSISTSSAGRWRQKFVCC